MTTFKKRVEQLADDQAVIDATNQFFAPTATLSFMSKKLLPSDVVKVFQDRIASAKAAITASDAKAAAVKADQDERANSAKFVRAFIRFVQATFSESPDTLAAFHVKAPRPPHTSAEVKAKAAAKGVAKRAAVKAAKAQIDAGAAAPAAPAPAKPTA